jgi:hypothetical protein
MSVTFGERERGRERERACACVTSPPSSLLIPAFRYAARIALKDALAHTQREREREREREKRERKGKGRGERE